ncbi:ABC transporter permease [Oceanicola sp. 22II-s10i]|uniref:thiamine/thiamine pyrophosphate ABC transporter permease ThiP n=1 Tax=Oceanicola sp. 22II-s10i TaxID=1317116 RepID=UPI000B524517|nr:thiamine/thiamine pyrophosphate ABC transporter permease ThiP [Oceanicola sp. 22II-s10i]OWU86067.1 ABC transporter permease [Oceanicola sp. 22II-s10i]
MAAGPVALSRGLPGRAAAWAVIAFLVLPLAAVLTAAGGSGRIAAADWAAIRFTVVQASLSALFSTALAIPVARALSRRRFPGRGIYIALMGAPFILPVIVAVLGLIAVLGRGGWVNGLLGQMGIPPVSVYGLHGVVLGNVFFNLPLATRLILQGWGRIPAERFRLAAQLDARPRDVFRLLEAPMLARVVPGVLAVIFAICLSSFAIALTLGGGPKATSVELAIFQSFTFEFDLGRAAMLAIVQFLLVAAAGLAALRLTPRAISGAGFDRPVARWDTGGAGMRLADAGWMLVAALFLLGPMAAIVSRGIGGLARMPVAVWQAAATSVVIALLATGLTLLLTLALASARRNWVEVAGLAPLAASPLVLGTGLFVLINPWDRPGDWAFVVTLVVNAVMALPYALRVVGPAVSEAEASYGRLADSLGLTGLARLRWLILPRCRGTIGFAGGIAAALSMGDLGVIALFADPERATLPLMVWRLMGAYQMEAAAGAALLLLSLSFALFALFDFGGRWRAET